MINQKRLAGVAAELNKKGHDAIFIGPSADLEYM